MAYTIWFMPFDKKLLKVSKKKKNSCIFPHPFSRHLALFFSFSIAHISSFICLTDFLIFLVLNEYISELAPTTEKRY